MPEDGAGRTAMVSMSSAPKSWDGLELGRAESPDLTSAIDHRDDRSGSDVLAERATEVERGVGILCGFDRGTEHRVTLKRGQPCVSARHDALDRNAVGPATHEQRIGPLVEQHAIIARVV